MMDMNLIEETVFHLLADASTGVPPDVKQALVEAFEAADNDMAKMNLKAILENIDIAMGERRPLCQDTGVHIFFVRGNIKLLDSISDFEETIKKALERATREVPLRPNAVHPITRKNPGNNIGVGLPHINYVPTDEPWLEITVFPKGAGSENMSFMAMLTPSQGLKGIKSFVLDCVIKSGGKPCPPTVIGIGIGGTSDIAMHIAKESLLRPIGDRHPEKAMAGLVVEVLKGINELGIGPMGMGGSPTALDIHVEYAYCHTASLPVAVNTQCWTGRKATARITEGGEVEYIKQERRH